MGKIIIDIPAHFHFVAHIINRLMGSIVLRVFLCSVIHKYLIFTQVYEANYSNILFHGKNDRLFYRKAAVHLIFFNL